MFSFKPSVPNNIFSSSDIQKLIDTFPPPEPRPGKDCLIRSRSGRNLVRSHSLIKRLKALLETGQYAIRVSNLPADLGVQDVHWLLEHEACASDLFFTRDRERVLPKPRQREILEALRLAFEKEEGLSLADWAAQFDLGVDTLQRMAARDSSLTYSTLEDGLTYSLAYLQKIRKIVLQGLLGSEDAQLNIDSLDQGVSDLPHPYVDKLCQEIISDETNSLEGKIEDRPDGLFFTPQSAVSLLQKQKEDAKKQWVEDSLQALDRDGYCLVSLSHQPAIIQDVAGPDTDPDQEIEALYQQNNAGQSLTRLQTSSEILLVQQEALEKKRDELAAKASRIAQHLWTKRTAGQELAYDQEVFLSALAEDEETTQPTPFETAIIYSSTHAAPVTLAFETELSSLRTTTTSILSTLLRTKLLAPLTLYTTGSSTIADSALQLRVQDFIVDWARRTLIPEILASIKSQNLLLTRTNVRDVEKFATAAQAAKTLSEITAATVKLARKLKVEAADALTLAETKRAILEEKVEAMQKVKRASDLLQNLTWILLATRREGLFVSSGKDTSRMVKAFQSDCIDDGEGGAGETAKRLGELRDLVKEGKDGKDERNEMRAMAKAVVL